MISYSRDPNQEIPTSAVKIIGLGGAGSNMLERIALDSQEGAQLVSLNTDIRTLGASLAKEKIQLGANLTKGLGTGGDPELGQQAILEAETEVRNLIKGQKIVFLCVGLGGGTGSGAAPIIARIAREEGAFVIVFATMPFLFEGSRRREQAETALNQLAVLSNALVTFDNNRMGELVLAKQGIHEAFGAADKMISESIKAVIRLVVKPGLIHVGLDELITALRTTRSRCLFGSGIADGKDRASKALRNALSSPLLDQGALLRDAQSVLVHLSGGESLTLFEIELLMQSLQKHVPEHTQILFGAAIDTSMGDYLSITLISSLPEEALAVSNQNAKAALAPAPAPAPAPA
ncbi:MAG: cell division protein FtsZ, partial [Akkermansiaceae bacterium]